MSWLVLSIVLLGFWNPETGNPQHGIYCISYKVIEIKKEPKVSEMDILVSSCDYYKPNFVAENLPLICIV